MTTRADALLDYFATVVILLAGAGTAAGVTYAYCRPDPVVIEAPYTPDNGTFQVGPIDDIDCAPGDLTVQTDTLRFCYPPGSTGTLVLAGCR